MNNKLHAAFITLASILIENGNDLVIEDQKIYNLHGKISCSVSNGMFLFKDVFITLDKMQDKQELQYMKDLMAVRIIDNTKRIN